jgi:mRNA interferase MazF
VVTVHADAFVEHHAPVSVCPLTSHLTGLRLFRIMVAPDKRNGLNEPSEVTADKLNSLRRERIGGSMGRLSALDLRAVGDALRRWLALA